VDLGGLSMPVILGALAQQGRYVLGFGDAIFILRSGFPESMFLINILLAHLWESSPLDNCGF